ncbi:hypothetical protein [Brevundimonas denitrificans]|uniref:hypothetical protein n=1 Tax=Brevundimonas denitrificans TaxID=1443434 RepID=UPI00223B9BF7|nr:hypothetical protein [Brevundimonas denitrificans]
MTRRNCTEFDKISRALFNLGHQDITDFENEIVSRPRGRKGSIKVAEQAFMKVVTGLSLSNLLEVGGNDGRHSRRFLEETSTTVHTFEPNVFAIPFLQRSFRMNVFASIRSAFRTGLDWKRSTSSLVYRDVISSLSTVAAPSLDWIGPMPTIGRWQPSCNEAIPM